MSVRKMSTGYTIIEVSIAITMLAIFLSIAGLSMTASEDTAKAGKIITDMMNIRLAANVYYMNSPEDFRNKPDLSVIRLDDFSKYLGNVKEADRSKYCLQYSSRKPCWYVRYEFGNDSAALREELSDRAEMSEKAKKVNRTEPELGIMGCDSYLNEPSADKIKSGGVYLVLQMR